MPTIPDWFESSDAWDRVVISGFPLPGISTCTATTGRKLDTRSVRGRDGARVKDGGYAPAKITVECIVWETHELQALSKALESLQPRGGSARAPVQISHPSLSAIGISQAYIETISAPVLEKGKLTTKMTFVEWTAAPPATRSAAANATTTPVVGNESSEFQQREARANSRLRPPAVPPAAVVAGTRT